LAVELLTESLTQAEALGIPYDAKVARETLEALGSAVE
jgi:hypothetical protein